MDAPVAPHSAPCGVAARAHSHPLLPETWAAWSKLALLAGLTAALYYRVVLDLAADWWRDPAYSHGFLVVPLAFSILWSRRAALRAEPAGADNRGLLFVLAGCAAYLGGTLGAEFFVTRLSLILLAAGLAWTFWGLGRLRRLAFPLLLLVTVIPLPVIFYNQLAGPLQQFASWTATELLQSLSVPIYRDGNIIHLAELSVGVAEACSGLRSISALAVLALWTGHLEGFRLWLRWLLLAVSVPIAIGINVARVAGTALLVEYGDPALALGFYHSFSGWLVFAGAFGLLWLAARLLTRLGGIASRHDEAHR